MSPDIPLCESLRPMRRRLQLLGQCPSFHPARPPLSPLGWGVDWAQAAGKEGARKGTGVDQSAPTPTPVALCPTQASPIPGPCGERSGSPRSKPRGVGWTGPLGGEAGRQGAHYAAGHRGSGPLIFGSVSFSVVSSQPHSHSLPWSLLASTLASFASFPPPSWTPGPSLWPPG